MKTLNNKINIIDLIIKKRSNKELSKEEIDYFVKSSIDKKINDAQIAALLECIYVNGLSKNELFNITHYMKEYSENIKINTDIPIIDKHSTGGIGDKVSIILCPLLASLGIGCTKFSGKGLGITGGTIDKLNSVNCKTLLNENDYKKLFKKYNFFIMEQTSEYVPSDKIFYTIRNDIGSVDNINLIASSIMSKKLITSSKYIYLDVKVGNGAFFSNLKQAKEFSKLCIEIGKQNDKKVICYLTEMNEPLGRTIGNKIEIYESINFLNGNFLSKKLKDYIYDLTSDILIDLNISNNKQNSFKLIDDVINNKTALNLLLNYLKDNGSKINLKEYELEYKAKYTYEIKAKLSGYVYYNSNYNIGKASVNLGVGRISKEDKLDYVAGFYLNKTNNEFVNENETIITIYSSFPIKQEVIDLLQQSIDINKKQCKLESKIIDILR